MDGRSVSYALFTFPFPNLSENECHGSLSSRTFIMHGLYVFSQYMHFVAQGFHELSDPKDISVKSCFEGYAIQVKS